MKSKLFILCGLMGVSALFAQIEHPRSSPGAVLSQQLGLAEVTISYSRPAARQRELFGGLVPYGRIWRVGANESTKFSVSDSLFVGENVVPPGTYALYAFPYKKYWEVVVHKNTGHWGDGRQAYTEEEDLFRLKLVPEQTELFQENFRIAFDNITHSSMEMIWHWGNTLLRIPISIDTEKLMEQNIQQSIATNPTAQTYYEAARYYLESDIHLQKALTYVDKALELQGETYYFYRVKSELLARLEQYRAAINSAQKSRDLAAAEAKDEFVRLNEVHIAQWSKALEDSKN